MNFIDNALCKCNKLLSMLQDEKVDIYKSINGELAERYCELIEQEAKKVNDIKKNLIRIKE